MEIKTYRKMTAAQVIDRKVITIQPISNSYVRMPTGSIATIAGKQDGYQLIFDPCPHCGVKAIFHNVTPQALDLLPKDPETTTPEANYPIHDEDPTQQDLNVKASAAAEEITPLFGCDRAQCAEETSHTMDQLAWSAGFGEEWAAGFYCLENCLLEIDDLLRRTWNQEVSQAHQEQLPEPPAPTYYAENPILLSNFK